MPVIINDFEMVVEQKPEPGGSQPREASQRTEPAQGSLSRPEDVEQIMRRLMRRRERLHAD